MCSPYSTSTVRLLLCKKVDQVPKGLIAVINIDPPSLPPSLPPWRRQRSRVTAKLYGLVATSNVDVDANAAMIRYVC